MVPSLLIRTDEGKTSPLDASTRRRQQVRRAQINHRRKKENYISALEEEVKRLRELVAEQQELGHLRAENQILKGILENHGIVHPGFSSQQNIQAATQDFIEVSLVGVPGRQPYLQPSMPGSLVWPAGDQSAAPVIQDSMHRSDPVIFGNHPPATLTEPGETKNRNMKLEAFDFVMK
ncbi:hypothetical protein EYZ11_007777 [Aspergillus tanneri]|uniref:BZIP domain-containing protein n=1 Tax=Aspergillus tanneri TaxID=1220188 RepID=A0A4S3JC38_9EURO|nr:hypothetical protein EYZ11_007777 [Aspergillus tanneri]